MGRLNLNKMNKVPEDPYVEFIKKRIAKIIFNLELLDKSITEAELQNEQFVLDFYDKLNEISIRK